MYTGAHRDFVKGACNSIFSSIYCTSFCKMSLHSNISLPLSYKFIRQLWFSIVTWLCLAWHVRVYAWALAAWCWGKAWRQEQCDAETRQGKAHERARCWDWEQLFCGAEIDSFEIIGQAALLLWKIAPAQVLMLWKNFSKLHAYSLYMLWQHSEQSSSYANNRIKIRITLKPDVHMCVLITQPHNRMPNTAKYKSNLNSF